MKRSLIGALALGAVMMFTACRGSQEAQPKGAEPPDSPKKEAKKDDGPPAKDKFGDGPPIIPPFVRVQLDLTPEQEKQLAELEKEFHQRVIKILTPKQIQKLESLAPKGKKDFGPPKDAPPKDGFGPKE